MEGKEVAVADRDLRIYLGECSLLFQKFDQIVLSAGDKYVDKMKYIADILKALGVEVEKEYLNPKFVGEKYIYKTEEKECVNERTGRKEIRYFHKLGLTKIPDLFMYTNPKEAIDLKKIKSEKEK